MIKSFKDKETETIFHGRLSSKLPLAIQKNALRKLIIKTCYNILTRKDSFWDKLNAALSTGARDFVRDITRTLSITEGQRIAAKVPGCARSSTCILSTLINQKGGSSSLTGILRKI